MLSQTGINQIILPGVIVYDEIRKKYQEGYQKAVKQAGFLEEEEKKKWSILGYKMPTPQLKKAQLAILSHNLETMTTRRQLDQLKSIKN